MRKLLTFMVLFMFPASMAFSQRIEVVPYPDAVPVSPYGYEKLYLSNTDARILMESFAAEFSPDRIIPVRDKYYSGYRLCFTGGNNSTEAESRDWIQVLTIDEDAALAWFQKNSPEKTDLPFEGLKECVGKYGHKMSDYEELVYRYRHLPCKMYTYVTGPDGTETDELTANIERVRLNTESNSESQYVSLSGGGVFFDKSQKNKYPQADPWTEWIKCFEDLSSRGYISLIEFNEPAITPF